MLTFADLLERYTVTGRGNYDAKSYELAEHFLPNGTEDQKDALAQAIQTAVEDHLWEPESKTDHDDDCGIKTRGVCDCGVWP